MSNHFRHLFEDKWAISPATLRYTTTPYFEKEIEKPFLDYRLHIPYDNIYSTRFPISGTGSWICHNGYMVRSGEPDLSFTFDLKKVAKLSRIVWPRLQIDQWWAVYRNANIMSFGEGTIKLTPATLANRIVAGHFRPPGRWCRNIPSKTTGPT